MSDLACRLSSLRNQTGPIFLSDDVPPFWIRRDEVGMAVAVFEGPNELLVFDERFGFIFRGFDAEFTGHSVVINLGYLQ